MSSDTKPDAKKKLTILDKAHYRFLKIYIHSSHNDEYIEYARRML